MDAEIFVYLIDNTIKSLPMKKIISIILLVFSIVTVVMSANTSNTIFVEQQKVKDIKTLYAEELYYDIIKGYASKDMKKMTDDELLYVGWSFYMLNELEKADAYVSKLLKRVSRNSSAHQLKGLILVTEGKSEQALPSFIKAIELDPTQGKYYTDAGNAYRDMEDLDKAIEYYKKGIAANKPSEQAYFMLADIYDYKGEHKQALATFYDAKKNIRKEQELYATVLYNIGTIEMDKGNFSQAIVAFNELAEYFPDDYMTYSRLVQCCYALGDYEIGDTYKSVLYEAYESGLLTDGEFAEKFCVDIFKVGDKIVSAYEYFHSVNDAVKEADSPIFVFYVVNSLGLVESEIQYKSQGGTKSAFVLESFNPADKKYSRTVVKEYLDYPKLKYVVKEGVANNYVFRLYLNQN